MNKNNLYDRINIVDIVLKSIVKNTLRFLPPLTISKEEIDEGFTSLNRAMSSL